MIKSVVKNKRIGMKASSTEIMALVLFVLST